MHSLVFVIRDHIDYVSMDADNVECDGPLDVARILLSFFMTSDNRVSYIIIMSSKCEAVSNETFEIVRWVTNRDSSGIKQ